MCLFLNCVELEELTDRVQPAAQARVLRAMGVDFMLHPDGRPKVLRAALESGKVPARYTRQLEPDLEAIYP